MKITQPLTPLPRLHNYLNKYAMRPIHLLLCSMLLILACAKQDSPPPMKYFNLTATAVPSDRQATLFFTLCSPVPLIEDCALVNNAIFDVYQSKIPDGPFEKIADNISADSLVVTGLDNGQFYYFKVEASDENDLLQQTKVVATIPNILVHPVEKYSKTHKNLEQILDISSDAKMIAMMNYELSLGALVVKNAQIDHIIFEEDSSNYVSYEYPGFAYSTSFDFASFNKDHSKILFDKTSKEAPFTSSQIYAGDLLNRTKIPLTSETYTHTAPQYSPDGSTIAYKASTGSNNSFNVWLMDSDGNNKRTLVTNLGLMQALETTTTYEIRISRLCWSPDGSSLYFVANADSTAQNGLFKVDILTGQIENLFDLAWKGVYPSLDTPKSPVISPDQKWLAFSSMQSGKNQIWLYHIETKQVKQMTTIAASEFLLSNTIHWYDNEHLIYAVTSETNNKILKLKI
jgi:hypothetical protein